MAKTAAPRKKNPPVRRRSAFPQKFYIVRTDAFFEEDFFRVIPAAKFKPEDLAPDSSFVGPVEIGGPFTVYTVKQRVDVVEE